MSQIETLEDGFLDAEPAQVEVIEETVEVESVEPEVVETETDKTEEVEAKEPEESTTDSDKDSWTFSQAMDEREKRQAAVKRADDLQARLDALEKPKEDISMFEDEKGYTEQQSQSVDQKVAESELRISRAYAVREFGEEKVAASEKWYADEGMKSPHAIDRINKTGLKFHEAVMLMDEEQARLDPDAYKAKMKAEILEELKAETVENEPRKPITPSLASSRSVSTSEVSTTDDDFLKD